MGLPRWLFDCPCDPEASLHRFETISTRQIHRLKMTALGQKLSLASEPETTALAREIVCINREPLFTSRKRVPYDAFFANGAASAWFLQS